MNKLILSLGLVAVLAAPAMAQSTYDDSANSVAAGGNSGVADPTTSDAYSNGAIDNTTTNSIVHNDPVNHPSIQRGDQGEYFGANGR